MTSDAKRKALIFLGLATIIIMVIAAGLERMQFHPGIPLPHLESNRVVEPAVAEQPAVVVPINQVFSVVFAIIVGGLFVFVFYKLIKGAEWKDMRMTVQVVALASFLMTGVLFLILLVPGSGKAVSTTITIPTVQPLATEPLGPVPSFLLWLTGAGLVVLGVVVGIWLFFSSSRRQMPIDLLAFEAEKAWQALMIGQDLKDVIINCYRQMSLVLQKERGLERQDFMTTGEFENLLQDAGIPHEPIHQLTRLFEAVRYGNWKPNPADEQKAMQCLEAIISLTPGLKRTD